MGEIENPLNVESLAAETNQGADDAAALPKRLSRYSRAHHRALDMSEYATNKGRNKLAQNLEKCGTYLLFRHYTGAGKVRLHAAKFCHKHLLCPLCAIRRGAKMVKAYLDRLAVIRASVPHLTPYLVTFTVKDGLDLKERFMHLQRSLQRLHKTRMGKGQYSEACKASAAVWSYEFKRGANSGQWHPHVHAVWLCASEPDQKSLSEQWKHITGDSFIVDITPFHEGQDVTDGFLEVFKYAVKFSDLPLDDNWHGYEILSKKRLIASFGLFRGVEIPDDLTDEELYDQPYIELLYRFVRNSGYQQVMTHIQYESTKHQKLPPRTPAVPPHTPVKHGACSSPLHFGDELPYGLYRLQMHTKNDRWVNMFSRPVCGECGDVHLAQLMDQHPDREFRLLSV